MWTAVFSCALASPSIAQVSTSTLPAVEVRAPARALPDPTATITRIGPRELAHARREGASIGELVDRHAGARILDDGGPLHAERLTVRGGSSGQAQLVIDGVPLSSPFATGLDVGIASSESTARAALIRGGAGAMLGDGALTGALSIETLEPARRPRLAVALRSGSQARHGLGAAVSAGSFAVDGEVDRTSGRFAYLSRLPGLPDASRVRENNDASIGRASARAGWTVAGGAMVLSAGGAVRESGSPGAETGADLDARERRTSGLARLAWRVAIASASTLELAVHGAVLDLGYDDPDPLVPRASRTTFASGGGEAAFALRLGEHRLRLGAGGAGEASRSTEHGTPSRGRAHVVVSDELVIGDWRLFAALRGAWIDRAVALPRAGVVWSALPSLSLSLSAGRSFRAPALDELYHPLTRGLVGNPSLVPETAWEAELGMRALEVLQVSLFARRIDAIIVYVSQNAFVVRPENLGGASALGVEIELAHAQPIGERLLIEARAAASVGASRLDASGTRVPVASPLTLDAELRGEWRVGGGLELSAFTRIGAAAGATSNLAGTIVTDASARWDAGVVGLYEGASIGLVITNLLDDRALESVFKRPLPGRSVLATLRVEAG